MVLDKKDKLVLDVLLEDARLTTAQISKHTGIPITTVHNRIKSMRKDGIIRKFTVIPDYKKIDCGLMAFVLAKVSYRAGRETIEQEELARKVKKLPEVQEVSILAGPDDLLLKLRVKDVESLNDFVIKKLREIPGIDGTQTMVAMKEILD